MKSIDFVHIALGFFAGTAMGAWKLRVHKKILEALFAAAAPGISAGRESAKVRGKALALRAVMQLFTFGLLAAALLVFGLPCLFAAAAGLLLPTAVLAITSFRHARNSHSELNTRNLN